MAKDIKYGEDARKALQAGIEIRRSPHHKRRRYHCKGH